MEKRDKIWQQETKPIQIRFIGTDSTVISLLPGQTYLIIEKTTEDWWLAANDQGKSS